MPEMGYRPVNKYLPPRPRRTGAEDDGGAPKALPPAAEPGTAPEARLFRWLDSVLSR